MCYKSRVFRTSFCGGVGVKARLQCGRLRLYVYYIMAMDSMQSVHLGWAWWRAGFELYVGAVSAFSVCISVAVGVCACTRAQPSNEVVYSIDLSS